ncbi:NADH-quinone oxidoreductase subunit N [Candidatus Protochlamydia phocaeensis]|uniref:NADH-quinone oxidoreductase subunit N n=1 Tax=Candidatus Protochlamydia phocaeensis TaxID=1414722 RepID=UPI000838D068|nr:NADH-quinone oxidoreductase subunit N [Candidatus Protochlamydia phocaeensis]
MNTALRLADFAAISPLLILFIGALVLLLIESISEKASKLVSFYWTTAILLLTLFAAFYTPPSDNSLLTSWLRFDSLAKFLTLFFAFIGLSSAFLSSAFFQHFKSANGEYYFLLLSTVFGLILIGDAADFLTLFLGLETLSIALYILCSYVKKWEISHEGAIKYFLIGSIATAFLLYGIALIYGAIGTTRFDQLLNGYHGLQANTGKTLFLGGIALVTLGLAFKAAIVPFHVWAPDVYEGASTPITAFMAVGTKAGAFAAFMIVFLLALPHFNLLWNEGISLLAYATLIYANIVAMRQVQLRRFFAYSGIAQAGFLLIPLAAGTPDALQAMLFYLVVYALATLGSFAVLVFIDKRSEGVMLHDLHGFFHRSPVLATLFTLCLMTLAGIPPTIGFFAKFYLFKVAFQAGYYGLVIVGLLATILSAFYYLRIVAVMLSKAPMEAMASLRSWPAAIVGAVSFAGIVLLSIYPDPLMALLPVIGR